MHGGGEGDVQQHLAVIRIARQSTIIVALIPWFDAALACIGLGFIEAPDAIAIDARVERRGDGIRRLRVLAAAA